MTGDTAAAAPGVALQVADIGALEATYQPFRGFAAWRGVHVDQPRWDRYSHGLTSGVRAASDAEWSDAQDRLLRIAALESGALDGLFPANPHLMTMVADTAIDSAQSQSALGEAVAVVAECSRRALVLASEVALDNRPVDANLMAVLQDVITEAQATYTVTTPDGREVEVDLPRRQYKPVSNYIVRSDGRLEALAPAREVTAEMDRLAAELASPDFGCAHPVAQAAFAHYALTAIHPFSDGNGRLARVVASIFLLRSAGVPLLVFADQWPAYYQAIETAQAGDGQPMADFAAAAALNAMDIAANLLAPRAPGVLGRIRPGRNLKEDPPDIALWEGADALLDALFTELREVLIVPRAGVRLAVTQSRAEPAGPAEGGYFSVEDPRSGRRAVRVGVRAGSRSHPRSVDVEFVAMVSRARGDLLPIALREVHSGALLEVALGDVYPLVLEPALLRVRLWVERLLTEAISPLLPSGGAARRRRPGPGAAACDDPTAEPLVADGTVAP